MEKAVTEASKSKTSWKFQAALFIGIVFVAAFLFLVSASRFLMVNRKPLTVGLIVSVQVASSSYITDSGAFPKRLDNPTLFAILSGADSGKVYMTFETRNISRQGEILDDWGIPLRVTRVSDTELKIESAGPDKIFGTADDITGQ